MDECRVNCRANLRSVMKSHALNGLLLFFKVVTELTYQYEASKYSKHSNLSLAKHPTQKITAVSKVLKFGQVIAIFWKSKELATLSAERLSQNILVNWTMPKRSR